MANGLLKLNMQDLTKILANLKGTPAQMTKLLGLAIKDALSAGRTALIGRGGSNQGIRSRYNVKYKTMLQAIGRPRWNGLIGSMNIAGPRIPLAEFPFHDEYPEGVEINEVKGRQPIRLKHAFVRNTHVYQREGPKAPRIPIRWVMGLSVAQMARNTEVMPKVEARIKEQLSKRLIHYIQAWNTGSLPARVLRGK